MALSAHFALLHLSLIDGVGAATIQKIMHAHQSTKDWWCTIYSYTIQDWMHRVGFSQKLAHAIVTGLSNQSLLDKELSLLQKHSVSWMSMQSFDFPPLLGAIHVPPAILYWQGDAHAFMHDRMIAFVGSRDADQYGKRVTKQLVVDAVGNGWTIVSGGAKGIDTFSHQEALYAGGRTVVVLGSGLLRPYPYDNISLFEKIVESGGAVVSTFSLQTGALPGNFPARNRVISGLSLGCLVIQAAIKSGACITAYHALEQGRDVFAVPGAIDNSLSHGCHALIQSGAKLVTSWQEIEEDLACLSHKNPPKKIDILPKQLPILNKKSDHAFSDIEQVVFEACSSLTTVDKLVELTGRSLSDVQTCLFNLQLENIIKQTGSGLWVRSDKE